MEQQTANQISSWLIEAAQGDDGIYNIGLRMELDMLYREYQVTVAVDCWC